MWDQALVQMGSDQVASALVQVDSDFVAIDFESENRVVGWFHIENQSRFFRGVIFPGDNTTGMTFATRPSNRFL